MNKRWDSAFGWNPFLFFGKTSFFMPSQGYPMRKLPQNGGIGMTDQEKTRISELRSQGRTYQEIAVETGIGLSAIKMHFKRLKPEETVRKCPQCGKMLGDTISKKKHFCSDRYRFKWWVNHLDQFSNSGSYQYYCKVCGRTFFACKPAKYCSRDCYYQSRRKAVIPNV